MSEQPDIFRFTQRYKMPKAIEGILGEIEISVETNNLDIWLACYVTAQMWAPLLIHQAYPLDIESHLQQLDQVISILASQRRARSQATPGNEPENPEQPPTSK